MVLEAQSRVKDEEQIRMGDKGRVQINKLTLHASQKYSHPSPSYTVLAWTILKASHDLGLLLGLAIGKDKDVNTHLLFWSFLAKCVPPQREADFTQLSFQAPVTLSPLVLSDYVTVSCGHPTAPYLCKELFLLFTSLDLPICVAFFLLGP